MSTSPAKNVIVSTKNDPAPNENADDISTVYQNFVTLYHEIRNMEKFTSMSDTLRDSDENLHAVPDAEVSKLPKTEKRPPSPWPDDEPAPKISKSNEHGLDEIDTVGQPGQHVVRRNPAPRPPPNNYYLHWGNNRQIRYVRAAFFNHQMRTVVDHIRAQDQRIRALDQRIRALEIERNTAVDFAGLCTCHAMDDWLNNLA